VKLIFKEELRPKQADALLFTLAPVISVATCLIAFAPVPFGGPTTFFGWLEEPVALQIADLDVGVLVVFAVASVGVYGIVLAGWASNSKYALLGGLRSSAQMISYELAYGMALATAVLLAGSMSFREIVDAQSGYFAYLVLPSINIPDVIPRWNVFAMFPFGLVAFLLFFTAGVAETNRAPFDFPEAEQELVAGYHTEYSSMRFAMFFMAEYINMVTVSAVAVNLFLGGWHFPFVPEGYGWIMFLVKLAALLFFYLWMRWTLPRVRYDQLMTLGWKILLPVATINLLAVAAGVIAFGL
jgi:NADH-quinone oxidoreductase subunit H